MANEGMVVAALVKIARLARDKMSMRDCLTFS